MKEYISRMQAEKSELENRLKKAKAALLNPPYGADTEGQNLLNTQVGHMEHYLDILELRIQHEERKSR